MKKDKPTCATCLKQLGEKHDDGSPVTFYKRTTAICSKCSIDDAIIRWDYRTICCSYAGGNEAGIEMHWWCFYGESEGGLIHSLLLAIIPNLSQILN